MEVLTYLGTNIFKQPPFFMGIIALAGLILLKKEFGDIIKGTAKTIMGVIILFVGVNFITAAASPLASAFASLYQLPETGQFDSNICGEVLA